MKKSLAMMLMYRFGIAVLVAAVLLEGVGAQQNQQNWCVNQLRPCLNYLNGNREPPDSCCDPLKSIIKNKPQCLCSLISNQGTRQAEQAGINVTEAQTLPGRCGQHVNPLPCLRAGGSPSGGGSNSEKKENDNYQNSAAASSRVFVFGCCWMNIAVAALSYLIVCVLRFL
ncbi:hypothetical protein FNV43_RR22420 [Rhamnella rubrinervis]|uniref:Bifunctional inhibitor/plant lipid transfer protein/seed storage helical domain-containing protein n=1 Tax=Rhamnella rubrinervis TaxID=2594499 RepID=A0A8K0DW54_9ROSA|nr:hypothetical protein FNV43_RR22420 [Rhamnella rubrinervis]